MRYLGCAYYPEYWGEKRVEEDASLMKAAGINCCRIGEFAWTRMEPREGVYTLDWLHHAVKTLGRHGIKVLLCTPTATPPAWLTSAYADTLKVRANGQRAVHGNRRHYCTTSDTYRRHAARIVGKLTSEFAGYKNVIGWQVDNELSSENGWCHCENCQSRFQQWLQERYSTIENLNGHWKTGFWSMDYNDWQQVRLSEDWQSAYPARVLDSRRFWSDMITDFGLSQAKLLRELHPGVTITTNGMGPIFEPMDYYKLFGSLDVACDDLYFDICTQDGNVLAMACFRGYRPGEPFWITETGCGALDHGKPPTAGQLRTWFYSALAHGCDSYFIFRWRTCLSGQEQELQGILEHSGRPRHRYDAVRDCFTEYRALEKKLGKMPLPKASVAIINCYDAHWAYTSSRVGGDVGYVRQIHTLHRAFYDRNIAVDVVSHCHDISGYKLLVVPSLVMIEPEFAAKLERFVRAGGVVVASGQLGMRDDNNNYLLEPGPDHLQKLFGCQIEGGMYLHSHVGPDEAMWGPQGGVRGRVEVVVGGELASQQITGKASGWIADLTLHGGKAVMWFGPEAYSGQPAAVQKTTGKGTAIYLGTTSVDEGLLAAIVDCAVRTADVAAGPGTPCHVEVVRRGEVLFVINHTNQPADVCLDLPGKAIVGVYRAGKAIVPAQDVCIIRTRQQ